MKPLAVSLPSPDDAEHTVGALAALAGLLGTAWALLVRWLRRRRQREDVTEIKERSLRYLLDAQRHTLYALIPFAQERYFNVEELHRQKVLIDQVRDQLWLADGHADERDEQRRTAEIVQVLTRTQAIQARKQPPPDPQQDMFREEDL